MTSLRIVDAYRGPGRLWQHSTAGASGTPVLMTHGTFSNAETLAPLAEFLAARGRAVYIAEWRGRTGKPGQFDIHDLAQGELHAALSCMTEPVHLLAHSGGGLGWCFALLDPELRRRVRSLTMLATQGTHLTEAPLLPYLGVRAADFYGRLRGFWPARVYGLGAVNETAAVLAQWVRFNRARQITTRDGADLLPKLASLNLPVFAMAGAGDQLIARPNGCRHLAQAFGPKARFHLCARDTDGEDFTHSRLIRSRAAARSVWPRIAGFLDEIDRTG